MLARLPDGPLDIIGDVHGEHDALLSLLAHLGYDATGRHPDGRFLVFVGDLCDRGPDSPAVLGVVRTLIDAGRAQALLGNHELNLLRKERKDGNDWFWREGSAADRVYQPWALLPVGERKAVLSFLAQRPLVLERDDLRVVHAAWHAESVQRLRQLPSHRDLLWHFDALDLMSRRERDLQGLTHTKEQELARWGSLMDNPAAAMPALPAVAAVDEHRQCSHPIRVLISGLERATDNPFFASGRWRFVERQRWWEHYHDPVPVVVGHYWRRFITTDASLNKGDPNLFAGVSPRAWLGARGNVFCVDFSAGGRFKERQLGIRPGTVTRLAALRWPERLLMTDNGSIYRTLGYRGAGTTLALPQAQPQDTASA